MRRTTICFFLISTGIAGCGSMRRSARTTDESARLTHIEKNEAQSGRGNIELLTYVRDSSQLQYSIRIWPKGKFSFSADSGFKGEASHIWLSGKTTQSVKSTGSLTAAQQTKAETLTKAAQNIAVKREQKSEIKKVFSACKWVIGVAMIAVFGGFYLFRKYFY